MTTLHDRLVDLAEAAPAALPAPGLWDRGVAYRRRRRTGTAVVLTVAAVALVVLGSATWLRSPAAVEPLPADSPGGMPDRLYATSEWLPGTEDAGPLGQIAALIPAIRHRWGLDVGTDRGFQLSLGGSVENGVVGVSATTGEYRFLDLPGLVADDFSDTWSLSPDGRYVAYLYRVPGSHAAGSHTTGFRAADGVALYDARTGEVRRQALPGKRGIVVGEWFWTSPGTVVLQYALVTEVDDQGMSSDGADAPLVWDVHVEAPHDLVTAVRTFGIGGAGPGFVEMNTLEGNVRVDPATGTILRHLGDRSYAGVSDPSGSRVAFVSGGNTNDGRGDPVVVQTIPTDPDQPPTAERVPGIAHAFEVYSWIDDDNLAVLQLAEPDQNDFVLASVDIHTGEAEPLVVHGVTGMETQLATDLLRRPTVPGIEPPRPMDPRQVTGIAVLILLAAGWALIRWRRRVRP